MKPAFIAFFLLIPGFVAQAGESASKIVDCPKEIITLLRADLRRAFLNVTFTAETQSQEDKQLDTILAKAWGGALLTFDNDDEDNEFQVTVSDGEGAKKRTMSFLYNQTKNGWELAGALTGGFPVGSPEKHDGWRDISTRESIPGKPGTELIRTYRYKEGTYSFLRESIDSGG